MSRKILPLLFGALCLVLGGCQTALRAPICRDGEAELPPGAAGSYHFIVPATSMMFSGAAAQLDETVFTVEDSGGSYQLSADRRLPARTKGQPVPKVLLAVCKVAGVYYSQTRGADGTYAIARLDISPTGLTTTGLVFPPKALKEHGFGTPFIPQFDKVDRNGEWQFESPEATRMIVDNRELSEARREELLSVAQPTVIGTVFSRVAAPKPGRAKVRSRP